MAGLGSTALSNGTRTDKKKVAYFYDSDIGNFMYVTGHPMKPHRIRLAHSLIMHYDLYQDMEIYRAKPASKMEMTQFHTDEYIDFLQKVTPDNMDTYQKEQGKYNVGDDCPVFDGLFEFCGISAGGSMEGAARLNRQKCDIAINWAGGLHHAKKSEASGFCYVNDIVLGILELLRFNKRVLYIDIDVHHGDGVEEAFFSTNRVMTVSFHKYDPVNFFPGTGALEDNGPKNEQNAGAHHAINVPLNDGITDEQYKWLFENIVGQTVEKFRPTAIVLQCGADSLAGDRLGRFNLQVQGHGSCVAFCKKFGLPLLLLGGGGYTPRNVARAWAYETAIAIDADKKIDPVLPLHTPWREQFRQDTLFPTLEQILGEPRVNRNTQKRLQDILQHVTEQLRFVEAAPSVQGYRVPPSLGPIREAVEQRLKEERDANNEELRKAREEAVGEPMEH